MPESAQCNRHRWSDLQGLCWASSPHTDVSLGGPAIGTCVYSICWRAAPASGLRRECTSSPLPRVAPPLIKAEANSSRQRTRRLHSQTCKREEITPFIRGDQLLNIAAREAIE